ncbi:hypothetical protein ABZP36_000658 [Zizania latifolia]
MVKIRMESLFQLCNDVVVVGSDNYRNRIVIAALQPRHVTSIMLIARMAKESHHRWKIDNTMRLRRMEQAVQLLVVLETALLPSLSTSPAAAPLIRAVRAYTHNFITHAMAAGGAVRHPGGGRRGSPERLPSQGRSRM